MEADGDDEDNKIEWQSDRSGRLSEKSEDDCRLSRTSGRSSCRVDAASTTQSERSYEGSMGSFSRQKRSLSEPVFPSERDDKPDLDYSNIMPQLQNLAGLGEDFLFVLTDNPAGQLGIVNMDGLQRIFTKLLQYELVSSDYLQVADFSMHRAVVVVCIVPSLHEATNSDAFVNGCKPVRELTQNESVGAVVLLVCAASVHCQLRALGEKASDEEAERLQELIPACMEAGADAVILCDPRDHATVPRFLTGVKSAEMWSLRMTKAAKDMKEDLEERYKRHFQVAKRNMIWKSPQTIFPHIPAQDPSLQERMNMVGDYHLDKQIGKGNFGTVYLSRHAESRKMNNIAIKVIPKSSIRDVADLAPIERELAILGCIKDHPNVLRVQECLHGKYNLYIIMEYLGEYSLEVYLRLRDHDHGRQCALFPFDECCSLFAHVIRAMAHLHSHSVCHRDIKPSNAMISPDGRVTMVDFGLAMQVAPGQQLHTACGTVPFVAPEVIQASQKDGYCGKAADVWSSFVLFLELLCGLGSTQQLLYVSRHIPHNQMAKHLEMLALEQVQARVVKSIGEDVPDPSSKDLRLIFQGVFRLDAASRLSIGDVGRRHVFAEKVGPLAHAPSTARPHGESNQQRVKPRLNLEEFNSKVDFQSSNLTSEELCSFAAPGKPKLALLEAIGGSTTLQKVVNAHFDWILARPEFARLFNVCPLKMGHIRAGQAYFLEQYLCDTSMDTRSLRKVHEKVIISDWLFTEFINTLIQCFRAESVRGRLAVEVSKALESLRPDITAGYRARLADAQAKCEKTDALMNSYDIDIDTFAARLGSAISRDARLRPWRQEMANHETLRKFASRVLEWDVEGAASTVFATLMGNQLQRLVGFFCDSVKPVFQQQMVSEEDAANFLIQLDREAEIIVNGVGTREHMSPRHACHESRDWFITTLTELCRGDPQLRYYSELADFRGKCLAGIFALVEGQNIDGLSRKLRTAHGKMHITDERYNQLLSQVQSVLRTMYPWPKFPPTLCAHVMRCLETRRHDVLTGSILQNVSLQKIEAARELETNQKPPLPKRPPTDRKDNANRFVRSADKASIATVLQRCSSDLLERLAGDKRLAKTGFRQSCHWDKMVRCLDAILAGKAVDIDLRKAHSKLKLQTYHFDVLQEHILKAMENEQPGSSDNVLAQLERYRETVISTSCPASAGACPVSGKSSSPGSSCPIQAQMIRTAVSDAISEISEKSED